MNNKIFCKVTRILKNFLELELSKCVLKTRPIKSTIEQKVGYICFQAASRAVMSSIGIKMSFIGFEDKRNGHRMSTNITFTADTL